MDETVAKQLEMLKSVKDKQPKMSVEEAKQILLLMANWCAWQASERSEEDSLSEAKTSSEWLHLSGAKM